MGEESGAARPYWRRGRYERGQSLPPGQDLAALRRGLGRPPGSVPGMWPMYSELTTNGDVTRRLLAEHIALGLFGVHQQSAQRLVHEKRIGVGAAVRALRSSGRYSEDAVDRRMTAAASAASVEALALHLRGLVQQLSVIRQPWDYDLLFTDLVRWQSPAGSSAVRRRWGGDYYARTSRSAETATDPRTPSAKGES